MKSTDNQSSPNHPQNRRFKSASSHHLQNKGCSPTLTKALANRVWNVAVWCHTEDGAERRVFPVPAQCEEWAKIWALCLAAVSAGVLVVEEETEVVS
jgi:hypothetical protein